MPSRRSSPVLVRPLVALLLAAAVACGGDGPTESEGSPIAGFARVEQGDSTTATPQATPPASPGYFRGTVYGYTPGPDSLATREPLAGVRVTAYVGQPVPSGGMAPGDEVAEAVTGADGGFRLPELPGGDYVVAFAPPASAPYRGVWTIARAWSGSGEGGWVIYLGPR